MEGEELLRLASAPAAPRPTDVEAWASGIASDWAKADKPRGNRFEDRTDCDYLLPGPVKMAKAQPPIVMPEGVKSNWFCLLLEVKNGH